MLKLKLKEFIRKTKKFLTARFYESKGEQESSEGKTPSGVLKNINNMAFLTGFRNWWKPKKGQEMTQLYDTKLANTVSEGKRVAKDLRKTARIFFLKVSRVTDLAETIKILNQASCKLDASLASKQAEYDLAMVNFLEADKDYNNYITLQEVSDKTNKNSKINNNERK